jgi:hypothetical protein
MRVFLLAGSQVWRLECFSGVISAGKSVEGVFNWTNGKQQHIAMEQCSQARSRLERNVLQAGMCLVLSCWFGLSQGSKPNE